MKWFGKWVWVLGIIAIALDYQYGTISGVAFALLPVLAIAGIGAGIGAISNAIFGGSKTLTDKQINELMASLPKYDDSEARKNLERRVAALLKNRQLQTSQKNKSMGINDPQAVYTMDEPIFNAQAEESNKITEMKAADERQRAETLAKLKLEKTTQENAAPSVLDRAVSGAITGFSLGSSVAGLIYKGLPAQKPKGLPAQKPIDKAVTPTVTPSTGTDLIVPSKEVIPEITDPSNLGNGNSVLPDNSIGAGGIGDQSILPDKAQSGLDINGVDKMDELSKKYGLNYNKLKKSLLTPYGTV